MHVNKSQAVLYILETFLEKGRLDKKETLEALDIPELTFRRYLSEIRCYFANFDRNEEIVYDKAQNCYFYRKG